MNKTFTGADLNELVTDLPAYWEYGTFDAPIVYAALESLKVRKPRVLADCSPTLSKWERPSAGVNLVLQRT